MILVWSLGFLTPYTIIGFIEVFLITVLLNFLLKKILRLEIPKIRLFKKRDFNQNAYLKSIFKATQEKAIVES
jgi:hypothetical protein